MKRADGADAGRASGETLVVAQKRGQDVNVRLVQELAVGGCRRDGHVQRIDVAAEFRQRAHDAVRLPHPRSQNERVTGTQPCDKLFVSRQPRTIEIGKAAHQSVFSFAQVRELLVVSPFGISDANSYSAFEINGGRCAFAAFRGCNPASCDQMSRESMRRPTHAFAGLVVSRFATISRRAAKAWHPTPSRRLRAYSSFLIRRQLVMT